MHYFILTLCTIVSSSLHCEFYVDFFNILNNMHKYGVLIRRYVEDEEELCHLFVFGAVQSCSSFGGTQGGSYLFR